MAPNIKLSASDVVTAVTALVISETFLQDLGGHSTLLNTMNHLRAKLTDQYPPLEQIENIVSEFKNKMQTYSSNGISFSDFLGDLRQ